MPDEFYRIAFRKKLYHTLEELQADADEWIRHYNEERTHSGKYCYGMTPMATFLEATTIVEAKMLGREKAGRGGLIQLIFPTL